MTEAADFIANRSKSQFATPLMNGDYAALITKAQSLAPDSPAADLYFAVLGLKHLGWRTSIDGPEIREDAERPIQVDILLDWLTQNEDPRGQTLAKIEREPDRAGLQNILDDLKEREQSEFVELAQARAALHLGAKLTEDRSFSRAEKLLLDARNSGKGDDLTRGMAAKELGRLHGWIGASGLARAYLDEALRAVRNNALLKADIEYERAMQDHDLRRYDTAASGFDGVVDAFERVTKVSAKKRARALASSGSAHFRAGRIDEGERRLQEAMDILRMASGGNPDVSDRYRSFIIRRDLGLAGLAAAGKAQADALKDAGEYALRANIDAKDNTGYRRNAADLLVNAHLAASSKSVDDALLAGDALVRLAAKYLSNYNERPHELDARLYAVEAYLAAFELDPDGHKGALALGAAHDQANRVDRAAAALGVTMDDPQAKRIIDALGQAEHRLSPQEAIEKKGLADSFEPLIFAFKPREKNTDVKDVYVAYAALFDELARRHGAGQSPIELRAGQIGLKKPSVISIASAADSDLGDPHAFEQAFIAPETRRGNGSESTDLFYAGSMLGYALTGRAAPNATLPGFRDLARLRWRVLSNNSWFGATEIRRLVFQLTSFQPDLRPQSAAEVADQLWQAAIK
ncbi:MAG: hypothetical protein AAF719_00240 [Pseudomonadota bacterium]